MSNSDIGTGKFIQNMSFPMHCRGTVRDTEIFWAWTILYILFLQKSLTEIPGRCEERQRDAAAIGIPATPPLLSTALNMVGLRFIDQSFPVRALPRKEPSPKNKNPSLLLLRLDRNVFLCTELNQEPTSYKWYLSTVFFPLVEQLHLLYLCMKSKVHPKHNFINLVKV